nr:MAG TPA: hypothetical protein [Caudoviricetes sp.]
MGREAGNEAPGIAVFAPMAAPGNGVPGMRRPLDFRFVKVHGYFSSVSFSPPVSNRLYWFSAIFRSASSRRIFWRQQGPYPSRRPCLLVRRPPHRLHRRAGMVKTSFLGSSIFVQELPKVLQLQALVHAVVTEDDLHLVEHDGHVGPFLIDALQNVAQVPMAEVLIADILQQGLGELGHLLNGLEDLGLLSKMLHGLLIKGHLPLLRGHLHKFKFHRHFLPFLVWLVLALGRTWPQRSGPFRQGFLQAPLDLKPQSAQQTFPRRRSQLNMVQPLGNNLPIPCPLLLKAPHTIPGGVQGVQGLLDCFIGAAGLSLNFPQKVLGQASGLHLQGVGGALRVLGVVLLDFLLQLLRPPGCRGKVVVDDSPVLAVINQQRHGHSSSVRSKRIFICAGYRSTSGRRLPVHLRPPAFPTHFHPAAFRLAPVSLSRMYVTTRLYPIALAALQAAA